MPIIITADGRNPALLDCGYATGVGPLTMDDPKIPVQPVDVGVWDELVANSDRKKAADKALAAGITVNVPAPPPTEVHFPSGGTFNFTG